VLIHLFCFVYICSFVYFSGEIRYLLKSLFYSLCLFVYTSGYTQAVSTTVPAVVRLGTYSSMPHHALQLAANQATLGNLKTFAAAVYGEKRFLLRELASYQVAVAQPVADGAFGLQLAYTGSADYNTSKIGIAYGQPLSNRVTMGVQFNYWNQHIRGYGRAAQVTIEGGLLVRLSEAFGAGFQVCNPVGVVLQKWDQKQPTVYTIGVAYQPAPQVAITAELVKVAALPLAVQAGIEYRFAQKLWAMAGINSSTAAFFIAAGFELTNFRIILSGAVHPQLGLTPGLLLSYNAMDK
jgi:hypothetical protein